MPRSVRWLIVLAAAFFILILTFSVVIFTRGRPAMVRAGSVLVLDVAGDLPELDVRSPLASALEGEQPVLHDLTRALGRAGGDPKVRAVYLRTRGVSAGWAKLQELREALVEFRRNGKKVYAFLEFGFGRDYFLASAADELYLQPSGLLDVSGLLSDIPFFKGTMEKVGIRAEMEQIGAFKNASDIYTRDSMSAAHREATNSLLDSLWGQLRESLAQARDLAVPDLASEVDQGFFSAVEARDSGLVDELMYEDQVIGRIEEEVGGDFPRVKPARYGRLRTSGLGSRLGIVYASGVIVTGESGGGAFGEQMIGSDTMVETLRELRLDTSVKAVVLRVDSPGGSGMASDAIWRETQLLRERKPLVVSMSDTAASGGYYIAMGADAIVAQPATLTGSIGVISGKFNFRGFYDWIGLRRELIKRGKNADLFSDYTSFTREQRRLLRAQMETFYQDFIEKAGRGRQREPMQIDDVGQGRVWTGEQALEIGLVDELGGLERAIEIAREKADIPAGRTLTHVVYPRKKSLWQAFQGGGDAELVAGLPLPDEMRRALALLAAAGRLEGEAVLAWNPDL